MLPLSHTYVSTKATNRRTPLLILGSILPDIATTSEQQIGRDQIHNSPKEFANFIEQNYSNLSDLGLGVRLHSQIDGGADFYSDDTNVGYAVLEGAKISEDVASLLEIPDGNVSLVLAHNFIEMAVDLYLYQNQREVWNIYNSGIKDVKTKMPQVAKCISSYMNLDKSVVSNEISNMINFLHPNNFCSIKNAVEKIALPLIKLKFKKEVSIDKALKITEKSLDITKSTYLSYLDNAVIGVKTNILGS